MSYMNSLEERITLQSNKIIFSTKVNGWYSHRKITDGYWLLV